MCKASPLDLAETTRDRLLVLDPDLTVRFADRSFGDAFTVTPKDTLREQEGQSNVPGLPGTKSGRAVQPPKH